MAVLILVLHFAPISGGAGFAIHILWWVTFVVAVLWLLGFVFRSAGSAGSGGSGGRWFRWCSLPDV
ncbi:hydrophobic protein [Streptomyces sp. NPDC051642]|uniref:hydrophobic protein n=1 Tax=Streptomyces sp. NPDC051642 TaxID=3154646 RepID=UPI00342F03C7